MKHRIVGRRLDRTTEHRTAMLKNMATSLFRHERIVTTTPKAKELKRFAEKVITLAKKASPHARRQANVEIRDVEVLNKLFATLGPRFAERAGGYTRVIRIGRRAGDNAEMSVIELVERTQAAASEETPAKGKKAKSDQGKKTEKAEAANSEKKSKKAAAG
jgi:large subunit ribosomal protein L17